MSFEVGHQKLGGRKRGVPNKLTKGVRETLNAFIEEQLIVLPEAFNSIKSPEKRVELLVKILPFVISKVPEITLDMLPDSKLDYLLETLKNEKERKD